MRYLYILALALLPQSLWAGDPEVIDALSQRSHIPVMEILPALDNCGRSQHTANICAYYEAFAAEMALDALVAAQGDAAAEGHAAWKGQVESGCIAESESRATDRSLVPMLISNCMAARFAAQRTDAPTGGPLFPLHPPQ